LILVAWSFKKNLVETFLSYSWKCYISQPLGNNYRSAPLEDQHIAALSEGELVGDWYFLWKGVSTRYYHWHYNLPNISNYTV